MTREQYLEYKELEIQRQSYKDSLSAINTAEENQKRNEKNVSYLSIYNDYGSFSETILSSDENLKFFNEIIELIKKKLSEKIKEIEKRQQKI